jgi:RimJ/RimL family protein N-acetyltransferase
MRLDDCSGRESRSLVRILETPRLTLRPFTMDDLDEAHRQFDLHPDVWRYDPGYPPSLDHRRRWLIYRIQEFQVHGFGCRAVELRSNGRLIGACGLDLALQEEPEHSVPVVELYFRLGREFWGKGYATEAVRATIRHAFDDLRVLQIVANASQDNDNSVALLNRVGFDMQRHPTRAGEVSGTLTRETGRGGKSASVRR